MQCCSHARVQRQSGTGLGAAPGLSCCYRSHVAGPDEPTCSCCGCDVLARAGRVPCCTGRGALQGFTGLGGRPGGDAVLCALKSRGSSQAEQLVSKPGEETGAAVVPELGGTVLCTSRWQRAGGGKGTDHFIACSLFAAEPRSLRPGAQRSGCSAQLGTGLGRSVPSGTAVLARLRSWVGGVWVSAYRYSMTPCIWQRSVLPSRCKVLALSSRPAGVTLPCTLHWHLHGAAPSRATCPWLAECYPPVLPAPPRVRSR